MHIINVNQITVNYGGRDIFQELSFPIGDRDRIGLVGPNGAGKSTLLKALIGELKPDAGNITKRGGLAIGYLSQDVGLPKGITLIDAAMTLPPKLAAVDAKLTTIEESLAEPEVYGNPDRLQRVLDQQETLIAEYERLGGARHASRVRELLARLGFTPDDYDLPTESLSGGQKKMVALVKLAVESPDLLLLDEPDNHLDMEAKRYLEGFIQKYEGAVLIVSHDRYLLDETVTHIFELEDGSITVYVGNYSAYANERELRRLRQQQQYVAQQKEIARIEAAIARFELWASMVVDERHIKQARSRRRMLDKMEERGEIIDKVTDRRLMELKMDGWRGSNKALEIKRLSMAFGDDPIFFDLDLLVQHGERVGLIGPNGAGKSVLFRLILGQIEPLDGVVKIGPSTKVGYYAQEHQTLQDWLHRSPVDLVREVKTMPEGEAVSKLLRMAFSYQQVRQPIGTMSGGERSRLQLLMVMLQSPNLLLLDEPTNNLDIASAEVLESALEDFEGAIFVISHDRYFLDRVVDRVVELDNGSLTGYDGGYSDYLTVRERKKARSA